MVNELRELWQYRHMVWMLVVRDIKARYRNSLLGVTWSFLQPLAMMLVMTFVFTKVTIVSGSEKIQNPQVFILSGILAWNMFSATILTCTNSIVINAAIVKKVYFPRVVLPIAAGVSAMVNYALSLPVFFLVTVLSGWPLHITLLMVPVAALIQFVFSIGIGMLLGTVNVFYRDTGFIVELGMLALYFLTPIFYDINAVAAQPVILPLVGSIDPAVWLRRLNPMASIVNIYQDAMYKGQPTTVDFWLRTALTAVVIFIVGYLVFRRYSPRFGEEI